jgi:hypothetical protein
MIKLHPESASHYKDTKGLGKSIMHVAK